VPPLLQTQVLFDRFAYCGLALPHASIYRTIRMGRTCCLFTVLIHNAVFVRRLFSTGSLRSYYLGYHSPYQILWGLAIGAGLGVSLYLLTEAIPTRYPASPLGRMKTAILNNPVVVWLQLRDGWAVWADGGREGDWLRWRKQFEAQQKSQNWEAKQKSLKKAI